MADFSVTLRMDLFGHAISSNMFTYPFLLLFWKYFCMDLHFCCFINSSELFCSLLNSSSHFPIPIIRRLRIILQVLFQDYKINLDFTVQKEISNRKKKRKIQNTAIWFVEGMPMHLPVRRGRTDSGSDSHEGGEGRTPEMSFERDMRLWAERAMPPFGPVPGMVLRSLFPVQF